MAELVFLKLGGSLITDKEKPYTPRLDILSNLVRQVAEVLASTRNMSLLVGHGSGSFGHAAAKKYRTAGGVPAPSTFGSGDWGEGNFWLGFAEVHYQAARLNDMVMQAIHNTGTPCMSFPPSASIIARERKIVTWDVTAIRSAIKCKVLPVVYGDVVFDQVMGGTILSTETLFEYLAYRLNPDRILLAGLEPGIWSDFPARENMLKKLTPALYQKLGSAVGQSASMDVTGGMESKVRQMLELVGRIPELTVQIFSGELDGALAGVLAGEHLGTIITAE